MAAYLSMGEAHRRITDYLNRFADSITSQDVGSLKSLLALTAESPVLLALSDSINLFQDGNRLIKQSEKYSQFVEILVPLFRSIQCYRTNNLADAYHAFEKAAKFVLILSVDLFRVVALPGMDKSK